MRKIPTLYERDETDRKHVMVGSITDGCEWVISDWAQANATRKFDGTCVMFDDTGRWWARREVRPGKQAPPNYQPVTPPDEITGKIIGWEPIEQSAFFRWFQECGHTRHAPGTYELVGPKINGNPENYGEHRLIRHGAQVLPFNGDVRDIMQLCSDEGWEGVVWHHADGRMAKLKVRDVPREILQPRISLFDRGDS